MCAYLPAFQTVRPQLTTLAIAHTPAARDPNDTITRNVVRLIDDVEGGRRKRPATIAEAEGRKR